MDKLNMQTTNIVDENIKHIGEHIFEEGVLERELVVRKFRTTAADGKLYLTTFYR